MKNRSLVSDRREFARRGAWLSLLLAACFFTSVGACRNDSNATVGSDAAPATASKAAETRPTCGKVGAPLSIRACGRFFVDSHGDPVQIRGVNISGLESVAIFGWSPANPWGTPRDDPTRNWKAIKSWGTNAVRLPLNEASWLGLSCVDEGGIGVVVSNGAKHKNAPGTLIQADPGGNYQNTVVATVTSATEAGLYVILDLHLSAPGNACPTVQNPMADADHALAFWTSLAAAFKSFPNVVFELFNEPFLDQSSLSDGSPWEVLRDGKGTLKSYLAQGNPSVITYTWQSAGMQQMLDAVRSTGATNVVLTSTLAYSTTMDKWLQYRPNDPAHQLGAVWHAYPAKGNPTQFNCIGLPACSEKMFSNVKDIQDAGFPVLITEFGDSTAGQSAPFAAKLLAFADANDIGYLGWTWNTWGGFSENILITDSDGTPTPGFGSYVKSHYLCRAAGTAHCP